MRKSNQTFLAAAIFATAFAVSYCLTFVVDMPLPRYYPLQHAWMLAQQPGVPAQAWYGKVAFALLTSAVAASLGYLIPAGKNLAQHHVKIIGVGACLSIIAVLLYLVIFQLKHWNMI